MDARHLARFSLVLSLALSLLPGAQSPPGPPSVSAQADPIPPSARYVDDEVVIQYRPGVDEPGKSGIRGPLNAARKEVLRASPTEGDLELVHLPLGLSVS